MMPPRTAQNWPCGCSMMATVPGSAQSTQCFPCGKPFASGSGRSGIESDLGMNLNVETGAMILGRDSFRPIDGAKGTA